jgi:hypothetical protein
MNNVPNDPSTGITRRSFLKTSAAAATTLGTLAASAPGVFAAGSDKIRFN